MYLNFVYQWIASLNEHFVVLSTRSATLLYILYIVGGGRARRVSGARWTARPNKTDQNKNAVRQPPVLASCIEIYYFLVS